MEGATSSVSPRGAAGVAALSPRLSLLSDSARADSEGTEEGVPVLARPAVDDDELVSQLRSAGPHPPEIAQRAADVIERLRLENARQAAENDQLRRQLAVVPAAAPVSPAGTAMPADSLPTATAPAGAGGQPAYTPGSLRSATIAGDAETVKKWLEAGVDANAPDELLADWPPLAYAAQLGHVEIINLLLDHGAKPDARDKFGETPLIQAGHWGQQAAAAALMQRGGGSVSDVVPSTVIVQPESEAKVGSWRAQGHVSIICSAPEFSLSRDKVMVALFALCEMYQVSVKFGYDWAGSATAEPADIDEDRLVPECCLSLGCACGANKSTVKVKGAVQWSDPKSVAGSLWFPKYVVKVQSNIMAAAQLGVKFIEMIAIRGGPVTQLEHRTMPYIIAGAIKDLRAKGVSISLLGDVEETDIKLFLRVLDYGDFLQRFYQTVLPLSEQGMCTAACAVTPSHALCSMNDAALVALGLGPDDAVAAAASRIHFTNCDNKVALSENDTVATGQGSAVCGTIEMTTGVHYVEFCILRQQDCSAYLGVVGPDFATKPRKPEQGQGKLLAIPSKFDDTHASEDGWVFDTESGMHRHGQEETEWPGQPGYGDLKEGDTVGLRLDIEAGCMAVYVNGSRSGVMFQVALPKPLRWAVELVYGSSVRVERMAAPFVASEVLADEARVDQEHKKGRLRDEFEMMDLPVSAQGIEALAAAGQVDGWHDLTKEEASGFGVSDDDYAAMHLAVEERPGWRSDDPGGFSMLGV